MIRGRSAHSVLRPPHHGVDTDNSSLLLFLHLLLFLRFLLLPPPPPRRLSPGRAARLAPVRCAPQPGWSPDRQRGKRVGGVVSEPVDLRAEDSRCLFHPIWLNLTTFWSPKIPAAFLFWQHLNSLEYLRLCWINQLRLSSSYSVNNNNSDIHECETSQSERMWNNRASMLLDQCLTPGGTNDVSLLLFFWFPYWTMVTSFVLCYHMSVCVTQRRLCFQKTAWSSTEVKELDVSFSRVDL